MTFKAVILLTRRQDMTADDFRDWWLVAHAPLARQLPKLRGLRFNLVTDDGSTGVDGISELWFDSRDDFDAAYATEIGQQVAADSMAHVSARQRLLVEENLLLGD
jgi:uncharacterized protein (TIGR02118 family)